MVLNFEDGSLMKYCICRNFMYYVSLFPKKVTGIFFYCQPSPHPPLASIGGRKREERVRERKGREPLSLYELKWGGGAGPKKDDGKSVTLPLQYYLYAAMILA
jgi:hypothetical protein